MLARTLCSLVLATALAAQTPPCIAFNDATTSVSAAITLTGFTGPNVTAYQFTPSGTLALQAIEIFTSSSFSTTSGYMTVELWDRTMSRCVKKVLPVFNRCVIFNTLDWAYHGHPEPLTCPPGWTRKSLALYYYTNGRPDEEKSAEHGTLYKPRPGAAGGSFTTVLRRGVGGTFRVVGNILAAPGRLFQKIGKSISPSDL